MTPEERRLADAFLAECWAPVREYYQRDDEREAAEARNAQLHAQPGDDTPGAREIGAA